MCVRCSRCANGHVLREQLGNPYAATQKDMVARCDRCRRNMDTREMNTGFSRCDMCGFDVCRQCIPKATNV